MARSNGTDVVVVGGGIAGLGVAWGLAKRGRQVTVLERGRCAEGASWGTAGWICPAQAGPLPAPGMVTAGLRSLKQRDSAFHMSPGFALRNGAWLTQFARHSTAKRYFDGARLLGKLGYEAFPLVDELAATGADFTLHKTGFLAAAREADTVREYLGAFEPWRAAGHDLPSEVDETSRPQEHEPALAESVQYAAVVGPEHHWHVDSGQMVSALADHLRTLGVKIVEGVEVTRVATDGDRVAQVSTSTDTYTADDFVFATGADLRRLGKEIGVRIPMLGGRGYSFTAEPVTPLTRGVVLLDEHIGFSPLGDRVRVIGTMELVRRGAPLNTKRTDLMRDIASRYLTWVPGTESEVWSGWRPMVPDGLPVLGRAPQLGNAYFAGGYSMLGITLGLPLGERLAAEITGDRTVAAAAELSRLSPGRFGALGWSG